MQRLTRLLAILAMMAPVAAFGQGAVLQGGSVTPGHAPMYVQGGTGATTIVQDSGTAAGGVAGLGLSEQLLAVRGTGVGPFPNGGKGPLGTNWCDYDGPTNSPAGYHFLCFSPNAQGGALISSGAGGTATQQPLTINVNGQPYTFSGTGGISGALAFLSGTPPYNVNNMVNFTNSAGALGDSGVTASGGAITAAIWQGTPIAITFGGTGATTSAGARTNLGLGTLALQNANSVSITGGAITGMPAPSVSADVATKGYVDSVASGLNILPASNLATAAVLPNTPTYANGTAGVGATLTSGSNSTLTVDGTVATLGTVVLVKDQASALQNGIYTVTTAGSGSAPWVLTRATYFDTSGEMVAGSYSFILSGTANAGSAYTLSAAVATVGTSAVNFTLFSQLPTGIVTGSGPTTIGANSCFANTLGTQIGPCSGSSTNVAVVASYSALRAGSPAAAVISVWVQGRTSATSQGSGVFQLDTADTTSADNDGTILVDAASNRWKRQYNGGVNVGWFNFTTANSASSNDAAIVNALSALGSNFSGTLVFPAGSYQYGSIVADQAFGLIMTSAAGGGRSGAGTGGTNLICTATCIKIRSSFDSTIQNLSLTSTSAASGQYLIDASHAPAITSDTRGLTINNVLLDGLGSSNGTAYTVLGINFLQVSSAYVQDTTFLRLASGVHGQNNAAPSGSNYSNNVSITNSNFSAIIGFPIINPGQNWTVSGGYTQILDSSSGFLSDGKGRVAVADPSTIWQNFVFLNHSVYDVTVGGTNYLDLGPGTNLQVISGLWGGIASSNMFIARGVISGVEISAQASNFSTVAFANTTGQLNWSFRGLNMCDNPAGTTGCSAALIGNAGNVALLNTDGVTPNSSRGTFSTTGFRYNADGTIEQWGISTISSGSNSVSFPLAFPTLCFNVTGNLLAPGNTANVFSLNSACNTTAFSAFMQGAGSSSLSWRAIGR